MESRSGLLLLASLTAAVSAFGAVACESDVEVQPTATSSGTSTGTSTATSTGGTLPEPDEHRASAIACSGEPPPGNGLTDNGGDCMVDGDCSQGENGRCIWPFGGENACVYDECSADADCGGASVCACRVAESFGMNRCFQGSCVVDSDCGAGGYCSPSAVHVEPNCMRGISPGSIGYFCHTEDDTCTDDGDCAEPDSACLFSVEAMRWVCQPLLCTL